MDRRRPKHIPSFRPPIGATGLTDQLYIVPDFAAKISQNCGKDKRQKLRGQDTYHGWSTKLVTYWPVAIREVLFHWGCPNRSMHPSPGEPDIL
jgi:hypothetical protein